MPAASPPTPIWFRLLMFVLFAPIALIGGCLVLSEVPTSTVRFRVTVEVDTPHGVRSGSSVMQSSFYNTFGAVSGSMARLHGQAVFVDLGAGRNVVMLLAHGPKADGGDAMAALPVTALTGAGWGWNAGKSLQERGGSLSGAFDLTGTLIPTMVTFPDLNDPASARVIYATTPESVVGMKVTGVKVIDRFIEVFGPGYALKRVRLETVSRGLWPFNALGIWGTPITSGIEEKMAWWDKPKPWLKPIGGGRFVDTRPSDQFRLNNEHLKRNM